MVPLLEGEHICQAFQGAEVLPGDCLHIAQAEAGDVETETLELTGGSEGQRVPFCHLASFSKGQWRCLSGSALLPPASGLYTGAVRALSVSPFTTRVWKRRKRDSGRASQTRPFG